MKKKVVLLFSVLLLGLVLVSCKKDNRIQIGILQYATAGALDQAREGFLDGLKDGGYVNKKNITVRVLNPLGNANDNVIMAKSLIRKSDLILAIATPSAVAVKVEADEQNYKKPILFTAVTDPVAAELIASNENPGGNVTGTNDMNPIAEQVALARELLPNATKLGVIYTANEENSRIQAQLVKEAGESLGFIVEIKTINSINDLQVVGGQLARSVDAIYVPTDNTVVSGIDILGQIAEEEKVPLIVGEENVIENVPAITLSIDYYRLGYETGQMAVRILKDGVLPKDIPSTGLSTFNLVLNKKLLESIGIVIPEAILERADKVFD